MSETHLHVTCAIIENDGCVLAVRRSRTMAMPGWQTPWKSAKIISGETAAFDRATLASAGQRETGVLHFKDIKAYALLTTFQKTEKEFSPTTMYADYPISRTLLHWESQSNTALDSPTGQNLVHHEIRGYTILVFARPKKKHNNCTVPFVFLGPATHVSHQKERPIQMVWELRRPMPVEMFEENRRGG